MSEEINPVNEFPSTEENFRLKTDNERLKQSNHKLLSKLQNTRVMLLVTVSIAIPLFAMLFLKGFLTIPTAQKDVLPTAEKPHAAAVPDTVHIYLYGNPLSLNPNQEVYCVAIGAFANTDLSEYAANLTANVRQTSFNGINQLTLGLFDNEAKAAAFLKTVQTLGLKDAYIMKIKNGKRVVETSGPRTNETQTEAPSPQPEAPLARPDSASATDQSITDGN